MGLFFGVLIVFTIFIGIPGLLVWLLVKLVKRRKRREAEALKHMPGGMPIYAGFWRRGAALFIDSLIMVIPMWGLSFAILPFFIIPSASITNSFAAINSMFGMQAVFYLFGVAYYVIFLASSWQATPGKRMMGVYVVRAEDSGRMSWQRALGRYFVFNIFSLLLAGLFFFYMPSPIAPALSLEDQQHLEAINQKTQNHQQLTKEDEEFRENAMTPMLEGFNDKVGITPEEQKTMRVVNEKKKNRTPLSPEEQQVEDDVAAKFAHYGAIVGIISTFAMCYQLIICLMVGLTQEKKGLHDVICKTRVRRGRPESPLVVEKS